MKERELEKKKKPSLLKDFNLLQLKKVPKKLMRKKESHQRKFKLRLINGTRKETLKKRQMMKLTLKNQI